MWTNRRSAFPRPGSPLEERELILPATHATAALGTHMPPNYPSNHHSLIIHIVHRQMFEKGIHQYHWCHWNTNSESKMHFQLLKMWSTSVYFSRSSILHSFLPWSNDEFEVRRRNAMCVLWYDYSIWLQVTLSIATLRSLCGVVADRVTLYHCSALCKR